MQQPRLAQKRAAVQWVSTLLLLFIPFVRAGGESLLRLDASTRTLHFFGAAIRIEEFYLVLLISLIFVFIFIFVTMIFGRVWCGWLCPQTTLTDVIEAIECRVEKSIGRSPVVTVVNHLIAAALAFLVASNLVWYFIPPEEYFRRLVSGQLGLVAGISLISTGLLVWIDLVFIRRYFCKAICPYGRIQLMAMDRNTLTLEFDPAEACRCIGCDSCVRVCPTGVDIRNGFQVECINCGRCLDACRSVLNNLYQPGIMHYTFGRRSDGGGKPVNLRSVLLAGVICILTGLLVYATVNRSEATIKLSRGGEGAVRVLPDGAVVNFYTAYLENRSRLSGDYDIAVDAPAGQRVDLLGPTRQIRVAPNENRRVDFTVKVAPAPAASEKLTFRLMQKERSVAKAEITLLVR